MASAFEEQGPFLEPLKREEDKDKATYTRREVFSACACKGGLTKALERGKKALTWFEADPLPAGVTMLGMSLSDCARQFKCLECRMQELIQMATTEEEYDKHKSDLESYRSKNEDMQELLSLALSLSLIHI